MRHEGGDAVEERAVGYVAEKTVSLINPLGEWEGGGGGREE
jgi:hypothetical protein